MCEYCDLELWSASELVFKIIIRNLIMSIFLSVSHDYVFEYCSSYSKEAATGGVL